MRVTRFQTGRARPRQAWRPVVAVVAASLLAVAGCAKSAGGDTGGGNGGNGSSGGETIKLGVITALTGPIAGAGKTFAYGGRIAAQIVNDQNLIGGGKKIQLVEKEGSEDPAKSASVMAQLAADQSITGVACCILSTVAGAATPIAREAADTHRAVGRH